tara:strand:+ start:1132 stop:1896 length:765 start_codon:yes stop_codon:yes gene_type:complete
MLEIKNLHVSIHGIEILKGINLKVGSGETHAIMGPNGSGKSTLAYVLAGKPGYEITKGSVLFEGSDLSTMPVEDRSRAGIFLSFQNPIAIPGVRMDHFIRAGYNQLQKATGKQELDVLKFDKLIKEKAASLEIDYSMTKRFVNDGFSGGERKKNEVLQMAVLEPKLALLDEIDSGLDVDALREVATAVNNMRSQSRSLILVTHYQRLLDHIAPDYVHVLSEGVFIAQGGSQLAKDVELHGYDWLINRGIESSLN